MPCRDEGGRQAESGSAAEQHAQIAVHLENRWSVVLEDLAKCQDGPRQRAGQHVNLRTGRTETPGGLALAAEADEVPKRGVDAHARQTPEVRLDARPAGAIGDVDDPDRFELLSLPPARNPRVDADCGAAAENAKRR